MFEEPVPFPNMLSPVMDAQMTAHWVKTAAEHGIKLDFHRLGTNGTRDECRTALENLILKIAVLYVPDETINTQITPGGDLYRAKSGLQKAIRKGDTKYAQMAAHAMINSMEPAQYWRRLSVIALEDIGLADPYASAACLAICSNKKLRDEIGTKKAAFWIAAVLAHAKKSRDLTHMMVYQSIVLRKVAASYSWPETSEESATLVVLDEDMDLGNRLAAFSALSAGNFSEELFGFKNVGHGKTERSEILDALKLPPLLRFLMVQGRRNGAWCLDIAIPFVWRQLCAAPEALVEPDPWDLEDEPVIIGTTHAAALDQYTLLGKRAIGYFKKSCHPVAKILEDINPKAHTDVMCEAVFYAEGGILRPWLAWESSHKLFNECFVAWFKAKNVDSLTASKLIATVQEHLTELHVIRNKFLAH